MLVIATAVSDWSVVLKAEQHQQVIINKFPEISGRKKKVQPEFL
jgi:hypothetical protein